MQTCCEWGDRVSWPSFCMKEICSVLQVKFKLDWITDVDDDMRWSIDFSGFSDNDALFKLIFAIVWIYDHTSHRHKLTLKTFVPRNNNFSNVDETSFAFFLNFWLLPFRLNVTRVSTKISEIKNVEKEKILKFYLQFASSAFSKFKTLVGHFHGVEWCNYVVPAYRIFWQRIKSNKLQAACCGLYLPSGDEIHKLHCISTEGTNKSHQTFTKIMEMDIYLTYDAGCMHLAKLLML